MSTLVALLKESVRKHRKKPALKMRPRFRTITFTYQQLHNYATGIAAALQKHDIGFQDRVIVIASNSPYWGGAFYGCLLRGVIVVPLNPQSHPEFIEKIAKQTKAKAILHSVDVDVPDGITPLQVKIDILGDLSDKPHEFGEVHVTPRDVAEIVYTSGTTGDPKGVVLTHANIMSNIQSVGKVITPKKDDKMVSVLPLFHMYEQTMGLLLPLKFGVEVMYAPRLSSGAISECLQEHKATLMLVVPELLETMVRRIEETAESTGKGKLLQTLFKISRYLPWGVRRLLFRKVHKRLGGKLEIFACGGAPLSLDAEEKWLSMGVRVLQGYGLTETSPATTTNTPEKSKLGSVGMPVPGTRVAIEEGEIWVKGPNVFSGYYHDDAGTKEVFSEKGWFKTGDMGYFDKDGFLYLSGRRKYMIVSSSGENVYPEDVEEVLKNIAGVTDAAVIGVAANGREVVHACLLGDFDDPAAIIEQANKKLQSHQKIIDWSIWPEADFPRSATRKVKKEPVIEWVLAQKNGDGAPTEDGHANSLTRLVSAVTGKGLQEVLPTSNLYTDLHLDSLMRIELVGRIEETFDSVVDESLIVQTTTVEDLQELIVHGKQKRAKQKVKKWLLTTPIVWLRFLLQHLIAFPLLRYRIRISIEGEEHLKDLKMPALFMPNHTTFADAGIVLWALPGRIRRKIATAAALDFMYEEYWFLVPIFELFFNSYPFPRREDVPIRPGLEATGRIMDHGFSILIYPEGQVSWGGQLLPLKRGAGLLATQMGAPVVPIIVKGLRELVPEGKIFPRKRGIVRVKFGAPLYFTHADGYVEATEKIQQAMEQLAND